MSAPATEKRTPQTIVCERGLGKLTDRACAKRWRVAAGFDDGENSIKQSVCFGCPYGQTRHQDGCHRIGAPVGADKNGSRKVTAFLGKQINLVDKPCERCGAKMIGVRPNRKKHAKCPEPEPEPAPEDVSPDVMPEIDIPVVMREPQEKNEHAIRVDTVRAQVDALDLELEGEAGALMRQALAIEKERQRLHGKSIDDWFVLFLTAEETEHIQKAIDIESEEEGQKVLWADWLKKAAIALADAVIYERQRTARTKN